MALPDPTTPPQAAEPKAPYVIDPAKLNEAIKDSLDRLRWARDLRTDIIKLYAGVSAEETTDAPTFVNLVEQAIDILHPQLTSLSVQATVEAVGSVQLKGAAMIRELALNRTADEIDLPEIVSDAVLDALLGPMAVCRVGLRAGPEMHTVAGREFNPGLFYASLVDFDDYVCDQSARREGHLVFEGDRYRITKAEMLASPEYNHDVVNRLPILSNDGDEDHGDVQDITGHHGDPYEFVEQVELWHIAVYAGGRTMIYTIHPSVNEFVREPYEYWGNERGPYIKLSFHKIPNNVIAKNFGARLRDIADAITAASEKVADDILTEKTVNVYKSGEEDFADALKNAKNHEYLKSDDPMAVNSITSGGVKDTTIKALSILKEMFNGASLAPDIMGGQKDNSGTATGASILAGNAQVRVKFMESRVRQFVTRIYRAMAWYADNDPMLQQTVVQRLPGGATVELLNTAELREGEFTDFNFGVSSQTAMPLDPLMKLTRLLEFIDKLPALSQLGPEAFSKITHVGSKALDEPLIDEINIDQTYTQLREQAAMSVGGPGSQNAQPNRSAPTARGARVDQVRSDMASMTPRM